MRKTPKDVNILAGATVLMLLLATPSYSQTNGSPAPTKPKIGIMKFEVGSGTNPDVGNVLYTILFDEIVKSRQFTVVDWEEIDRVLKVVAKSQPTVSPEDARKQAVHQLGLEKMYLGSVSKLGSKYYLAVKILNFDLTVERSERETAASEEELERAVGELADTLLGRQKPVAAPAAARLQPTASAPVPPASGASGSLPPATKDKPFVNSLGMKFVPIPGTRILFCIWETRVQDYQAFVKDSGSQWSKPDFEQGLLHPAVNMSWEDAKAFCKWLTKKERTEGRLTASQEYRLPTEAEWNKAVGMSEYPWGDQWPPPRGAGNYHPGLNVDEYEKTSPVGSFAANQFGLFDMGGNIWEWSEDLFQPDKEWRVLRSASFHDQRPDVLLSSSRIRGPTSRGFIVGFRCLLAVSSGASN